MLQSGVFFAIDITIWFCDIFRNIRPKWCILNHIEKSADRAITLYLSYNIYYDYN